MEHVTLKISKATDDHRCYHCHAKTGCPTAALQHCIATHAHKSASILQPYIAKGRIKYQSVHFDVTPEFLSGKASDFFVDEKYVLHLPDRVVAATPGKKLAKHAAALKQIIKITTKHVVNPSICHRISSETTTMGLRGSKIKKRQQKQHDPEMTDSSGSETSVSARQQGNQFYRQAHVDGIAPVLKKCRLQKAMECYTRSLRYAGHNSDLVASSAKNYAKSTWAMANMIRQSDGNTKEVVHNFKEAIVHFGKSLLSAEDSKDPEWVQDLTMSYRACYHDAIHSLDNARYEDRCRLTEHYLKCMVDDTLRAEMNQELATLLFHHGVTALDNRDYKTSMYAFNECYQPKEEMKRWGRDQDDIMTEARVLEDDLVVHMASAEALQAIITADQLLEDVLKNEESLNMNMVYEILDWYKKAVILSSDVEAEREAVANSRLGSLYHKVLKINFRAKEYYQQSVQLAFSMSPRNFGTEDWFRVAADSLEKFQQESLSAQQEAEQKEKQKYLDELSAELESIKTGLSKYDDMEFVKFIYKTFPPKNKEHTPPAKSEMEDLKHDEKKKVLQKAVLHYHPDKINVEKDGRKWQVLCEEITKEFTRKYESYK